MPRFEFDAYVTVDDVETAAQARVEAEKAIASIRPDWVRVSLGDGPGIEVDPDE